MLEEIQEKCKAEKLTTKLTTRNIEFQDGRTEQRTELFIQIPVERDFKNIVISNRVENQELIYQSNFYKYKFIKGYEAIFSPELGIIECEVHSDDHMGPARFYIRRLAKILNNLDSKESEETTVEGESTEKTTYEFPSPSEGVKIFIGESSIEFSVLSGLKRDAFVYRSDLRPYHTIRIEGLKFEKHSEAKDILQALGNSVLFQIDLITNMPIHLSLDRDVKKEMRLKRRAARQDLKLIQPKFQYDQEAISLYWYARTASSMPLLQFLAFYQVLEFYFPKYSSLEAQQKIKNLLKDPTFDRNEDKNISRILDIAKSSSKGKTFGDERSQIKATLQYCLEQSQLVEFFEETEARKDFFDAQKKSKSLVKQKISFTQSEHDIRLDVAIRIYELRCRIVHTKDDSDIDLLLPFSEELAHLNYDIELIEYIARKVLMVSSKPLKIK